MARTIYTYLHNDDLNGSRYISMDDCMCELYDIKRDDSKFMQDFNDKLQKPALYILMNAATRKAYIGETDDFIKRINQHLIKKDFWNEVFVFLGSNEAALSKTEVQYLEYLAYNRAIEVKSYDLAENTQSPKNPHMGVVQKGKADKFFSYVRFLSKFAGNDIFESSTKTVVARPIVLNTPKVRPVDIQCTSDDLKGRVLFSLNGNGKYNKREIVLAIVKQFLKLYPTATLSELKSTFRREFLGRFAQFDFIQEDVETAKKWKELGEDHVHYFINDVLRSGDGVDFVVCVEWDRTNIIKVLGIAKAMGCTFEIIK